MRSILLVCSLLGATAFAAEEAAPQVEEPPVTSIPVEVSEHDVLRADLAAKRAALITELRRYAEAGDFPINDFQTGLASQFMDDNGTPCAMADLITFSGGYDLVAAQWARDNSMRFEDLTEGPIHDWVLHSGLLLEEAAMVQVPEIQILPQHSAILFPMEVERQRAHLQAAATALELSTEDSLDVAMERLIQVDAVAMAGTTPPGQ